MFIPYSGDCRISPEVRIGYYIEGVIICQPIFPKLMTGMIITALLRFYLGNLPKQTGLCQHLGIERADLSDFKKFSHACQKDQKEYADNNTNEYMGKKTSDWNQMNNSNIYSW